MLRITRKLKSATPNSLAQYDTVDIPIIGIKYLYDNYFSVNGYRWTQHSGTPTAVTKRAIDAVQFLNSNVKAYGTIPSGSNTRGWLKNDTVINTGSGSTALWFCNGSQWLTR